MDHLTICSAGPLSSTEHFSVFQLIIMFFSSPTLQFWLTLTALISVVFHTKKVMYALYATRSAPNQKDKVCE